MWQCLGVSSLELTAVEYIDHLVFCPLSKSESIVKIVIQFLSADCYKVYLSKLNSLPLQAKQFLILWGVFPKYNWLVEKWRLHHYLTKTVRQKKGRSSLIVFWINHKNIFGSDYLCFLPATYQRLLKNYFTPGRHHFYRRHVGLILAPSRVEKYTLMSAEFC